MKVAVHDVLWAAIFI